MGNSAILHWVVKRGSRCLVLMPPCRSIVTRKGLTHGAIGKSAPKQESVLSERVTTAFPAILESDLALEEKWMTLSHVETKLLAMGTTLPRTLRPWGISCCREKKRIMIINSNYVT